MPVAVITGAAKRVGRALAESFAKAGFDLILHANKSLDELNALQRNLQTDGALARTIQADFTKTNDVERFCSAILESHSCIDVMIHNASLFEQVPFDVITPDQLRSMITVHLEAPFLITQYLLPALKNSPNANVIHLLDASLGKPYKGYAHYYASKAGLADMTRTLALELAPHVRVNAIAPGVVVFPKSYSEQTRERILSRVPLQREGSPEDVAQAALFCVRSTYMTGNILTIDGGRSIAPA